MVRNEWNGYKISTFISKYCWLCRGADTATFTSFASRWGTVIVCWSCGLWKCGKKTFTTPHEWFGVCIRDCHLDYNFIMTPEVSISAWNSELWNSNWWLTTISSKFLLPSRKFFCCLHTLTLRMTLKRIRRKTPISNSTHWRPQSTSSSEPTISSTLHPLPSMACKKEIGSTPADLCFQPAIIMIYYHLHEVFSLQSAKFQTSDVYILVVLVGNSSIRIPPCLVDIDAV
jgi:hypothetical protein